MKEKVWNLVPSDTKAQEIHLFLGDVNDFV